MNQILEPSQFIYGKFVGRNSGYRLVAYTSDLSDQEKRLLDIAEQKYYFWGPQGIEGDYRAVGIVALAEEFLLFQASPAVDRQGSLLASGTSPFEQYRYVFLSQEQLNQLNNQPALLLFRLFEKHIPCFSELNVPYLPSNDHQDSEWTNIASIFAPPSTDELATAKVQQVLECLRETNLQGQSLLLMALAAFLNGQRLLLTLDNAAIDPALFLESLLLLLPASCRSKVSIAAGSVDEHRCVWADLIVKTNGFPVYPLPENLIWLNRETKEFKGQSTDKVFEHEYSSGFISSFQHEISSITKLLESLERFSEVDFALKDLSNPDSLVLLIPTSSNQQLSLWIKYIPISNRENLIANFSKIHNSQVLITVWQALKQLYAEQVQYSGLMLAVLKRLKAVEPDEEVKILESDLPSLPQLFEDWLDQGVLRELIDEYISPQVGELLKRICASIIHRKSYQDFQQAWNLAEGCITQFKAFEVPSEQFLLLDTALNNNLPVEIVKARFNDSLASKLPYLSTEQFNSSNLLICLESYFPYVASSVRQLLEERVNVIDILLELVHVMEMEFYQIDRIYSNFLEAWSLNFNNASPLLASALEKSLEGGLEFKKILFPCTFQWLESAYPVFFRVVDLVIQDSRNWLNWNELATDLFQELQKRIVFLDRTVSKYFSDEVMHLWLSSLEHSDETDINIYNFLDSYSWSSFQNENLKRFLASHPNLATILMQVVMKSGRIDLVSGCLLYYVTRRWSSQGHIDAYIWDFVNSPTLISCLTNKDWLNLLDVKWSTKLALRLFQPNHTLSEVEKNFLYKRVVALFDSETADPSINIQDVLNDFYSYVSLSEAKLFTINFTKVCRNYKQTKILFETYQCWDHNLSHQVEILTYIAPSFSDLDLVIQLINLCNSEENLNDECVLIDILFRMPILDQAKKDSIRSFLMQYISQTNNSNALRKIASNLICNHTSSL